jgi:HK97 family phage major capsid protein
MTDIGSLTRDQAFQQMQDTQERMEALGGKHRLSRTDETAFAQLGDDFEALARHVEKLDRCAAIAAAGRGGGAGALRVESATGNDPYAAERGYRAQLTGSPVRDSAMRVLEKSVRSGLPAAGAEVVERLVDTGPDHERSWAARWVTDTGSPDYRSAFAKLVMHGEARASLEWTAGEREAYDRVSRLKSEQRALSLTDSAGGFLVPFELDPTVIITSAGSTNPLLQISRVVSSVSDIWHGVSSAGVQASWDAEAAEVSDDSPPFAEPTIPNYKGATFIPFSIELAGDAPTLLNEIGRLLSDGMLQLLNAALTTGSGSGCPTGIIAALTGGSSVVNTATADTLVDDDVYAVQNSAGPRWQANSRWCANLKILNLLRTFETSNGALQFPELRNDTPTLLGRPVHELSNMDSTLGGGAGNDPVLLYGDFSNFVVTQRIGSSVELIPHLFGSNLRPTGQRGMYMYARYGSDSVNDAAFRLLVA